MASWEPDEIDFEDQYDKVDTIDDDSLDESMIILNKSIREQKELQERLSRAEWKSMNEDEIAKLGQRIAYKVAFENERGTNKNILSAGNRWLEPNSYLRIFGKKFMKDMGFDVDKPRTGTKSKIPKKRIEQIEQYVDEIDDNRKQFASELNKLPMNEDNRDIIRLQDIINKNEIATDNSIKLIETSLTETGSEASTQTGGLTLRELEGLDRDLRMISGSLRSAIAKSIAKQVDIDREN